MKIFSLQSKKSLVAWSVVIGFLLNWFSYTFIKSPSDKLNTNLLCGSDSLCINGPKIGFPIHTDIIESQTFGINLLFWILAVVIILSLIRYFKNKKA
jgi:hypothetical protein